MAGRGGRRGLVLAVAAALAATTLGSPVHGAGRRDTADPPHVGYALRGDGTAAGAWVGSRHVGRAVVYRIDPRRGPVSTGFGPARWTVRLRGSGPRRVTRSGTRRAAWVVAKYGTYPSPAQSAAVEVALTTLVFGGRSALGGERTRRRLRQTGAAAAIRSLARQLLRSSAERAGPYRVVLRAHDTVVGGRVRLTLDVTAARTGRAVPYLPVELTVSGRTRTTTTDAAGAVVVGLSAPTAGPHLVRAVVRRLPPTRLLVRAPARGGGSRVVVAGRKRSVRRTRVVAVRARPTVTVLGPTTARRPDPVPGLVLVAGGHPSSRTAALSLHGPFAGPAEADCATAGPAPVALEVVADGRYPVPDLRATRAGYYRWSAELSGNAYNLSAGACGPPLVVRAVPVLTVAAADAVVRRGAPVRATVRVRSLPGGYAADVPVRLYGPFATRAGLRCHDGQGVRRRTVALTGPRSRATTGRLRLGAPGFYAWQAVLPASELSTRELSGCADSGTTVRVR